ncbi:MAG: sigma 54-interacting transcriptional regulator [Acidobacteriota bacterium]
MDPCCTRFRFALQNHRGGQDHTYLLRHGLNRVGRLPGSEVCLAAGEVSKRHAILAVDAHRVRLEDLASKNGTYVDGQRLAARACTVRPGSELRFGSLALRLEELAASEGELAIQLPNTHSVTSRGPVPDTTSYAGGSTADGLVFAAGYLRSRAAPMQPIYRQLAAVARSRMPILIRGETGVGKEGLARVVHESSTVSSGPFVAINCAALPSELIEAELFGIARGTASGVTGRRGRFEQAHGGTLFLDEIGDMAPDLQAKILRALQEQEIQPLGRAPVAIDVRIVAATNARLEAQLRDGTFRHDLYYRLAGLELELPPLRRRPEDIAPLVELFLQRFSRQAGKTLQGITVAALERLAGRRWPGNVRQLEHEVRRLVYLCPDFQPITSSLVARPANPEPPAVPGIDFQKLASLELANLERAAVREALRRAGGNLSRSAPLLGIGRDALRRRMKRFGL